MKKVNTETMMVVDGGFGYYYNCGDGYESKWHMFYHTAKTNARNHEQLHRTVCYIYHG